MKRIAKTIIMAGMTFTAAFAMAQGPMLDEQKTFSQKVMPQDYANYSYLVMYISDGQVYTMRSTLLNDQMENARKIAIQPGVAHTAVLIKKKDGKELKSVKVPCAVEIYGEMKTPKEKLKDKNKVEVLSIGFTADGKSFVEGMANNKLKFFETKQYEPTTEISLGLQPQIMTFSKNTYFAAVSDGKGVEVWNLQDNQLRTSLSPAAQVNAIAFSEDNSMMAVLTADGKATVYDTRTFKQKYQFGNMGQAIDCQFHPDNKYLGVTVDENTIILQNMRNEEERLEFKNANGHIKKIQFIESNDDETGEYASYLLYTSGYDVVWQTLASIKINLTQYINDKVNAQMTDWLKMAEGESMEDYRIRVNDQTRAQQKLEFERAAATEMAGDIIKKQNVKLGNYNLASGKLAVDFDGLPSITLDVPKDEVASISKTSDLEFANTVYGVNDNDEFEIIYTEVLNNKTGKKYVYDNLDRKQVTAMTIDEGFVPLELIQQSSMEEMKLKEIKKKVMEEAKHENKITDHTNISVNTEVLSDVDASGKQIMNYKVGYNYEVEQEFIAHDDFGPGKYKTAESNAAMSMLAIVKEAFNTDFAQYIKAGKQIKIKFTGSADAAPIMGKIAYDGSYGEYENELIYKNGKLDKLSLNKAEGITQNEQLAFVRALGVKDYIEKNVPSLKDMKTDYQYNIEVSDKKGGEYRRIGIEFLFIDAF